MVKELLMPIILRYLIKEGYLKSAKRLQREYGEDLTEPKYKIHKKKLKHIIKYYIDNNNDLMDEIKKPKIIEKKEKKIEEPINEEIKSKKIKKNKYFSRIETNDILPELKNLDVQEMLKNDEQGSFGYGKLGHNVGKNFRKEKNKLKKRESYGKITSKNNIVDL